MSNLDIIKDILSENYLAADQDLLIEENRTRKKKGFRMEYPIHKRAGIAHCLYRYEDDAFPFFKFPKTGKGQKGVKGLKKMCDYILFAEEQGDDRLYIFLIELKLGPTSAQPQLEAAQEFVHFIVNTAARVGLEIEHYEIRKLRICDKYAQKKGTNIRTSYEFDHNGYCDYRSSRFQLTALIKNI